MGTYAKYVKIAKFEELTGYTDKAVRRKIQEGVFVQGKEWIKAPDGHILINMEAYNEWANPRDCREA